MGIVGATHYVLDQYKKAFCGYPVAVMALKLFKFDSRSHYASKDIWPILKNLDILAPAGHSWGILRTLDGVMTLGPFPFDFLSYSASIEVSHAYGKKFCMKMDILAPAGGPQRGHVRKIIDDASIRPK